MKKTIGGAIIEKPIKMAASTRKFLLTLHILFSVGWLGAVLAYLSLAITGLVSQKDEIVRMVYPALALVGWYVIVPCSLAALLTGLVQSLGTHWGGGRYYWVFLKFLLTFVASIVLVNHMPVVSKMANMVGKGQIFGSEYEKLQIQLLVHAAGGLLILLTTTVLSVYKPWGKTGYGLPKQEEYRQNSRPYLLLGIAGLVILFVIVHLITGGMRGHH
ncbi:hypothetical protein JN11_00899 [Mucilaginibacter frigoritolerans]|uniref:Uncharacterized protein n=1 Tax=Mucilaginibacter frigoritolerans TaxID=652788 RepID=A0A562UDT7_9SPHI|nr:hypothetical protein [Mucilaginibacter frigoritolerans]TWJ03361.1 hypothetical protein JN11_00899 [Mucilaginibacter frigoritolerans]